MFTRLRQKQVSVITSQTAQRLIRIVKSYFSGKIIAIKKHFDNLKKRKLLDVLFATLLQLFLKSDINLADANVRSYCSLVGYFRQQYQQVIVLFLPRQKTSKLQPVCYSRNEIHTGTKNLLLDNRRHN